ncbi:hypothetical protein OG562_35325 [Streptomyces sp. NBC_01275]|uniref:hypothetical protein n=1 Tax=Streptomyces sp. NBC_01275 TaxID=2903807 RepID=UPI0022508A1E|nr:hypothetical protein [Streptomyces sp. NBC_01275]MCX4766159.1 hypothetical protein [Streptomyces sp. NBC_01275]
MPDRGGAADAELEALRARIAALEAQRAPGRPSHHRIRSVLAVVLIVLGCVLAPLGVVAAWTSSIVGDTGRYVDTVRPLASDEDIQNAAANRVTNALMERLDLTALLQDAIPAQRPLLEKALGRLGPSLEGAVRSFVHDKAQAVVASDAFEKIWTDANRRIHSAVDKALTGSGGGAVKIENDTVNVDLAPVVDQVKQRLVDSGMTVAGKIPEIHTDFTVVRSDDIGKVKTYFRLLELAGVWVPVVAVVLVAAGILLSTHRRRVLIVSALCFAFATLLLGVALTVFRVVYLDALPASVSQPAAGSVYDTMTRFLRTGVRVVAALGLVIALAAWLTGPGRHAALVRRLWHEGLGAVRTTADHAGLRTGPVGPFLRRYRTWVVWILAAAAVLAYLLWSYPTGWVVVGLALALLFALSVVDFLAFESADSRDSRDSLASAESVESGEGPGNGKDVPS